MSAYSGRPHIVVNFLGPEVTTISGLHCIVLHKNCELTNLIFRDRSFKSIHTRKMSPAPPRTFMEAMDDSMASFIGL